jgi:hypothetical protein
MTPRTLTAGFEGRFMCRLATDPDPNDEDRGRSGYTMALTTESPLDQVIRLQHDEYVTENLREPGKTQYTIGVTVRWVELDGKRAGGKEEHPLVGATVRLEGAQVGFEGPIFESRNNIVGSDDTLAFVVNPFELVLESPDELMPYRLKAIDHLNPEDHGQNVWQMGNPKQYGRRLPVAFNPGSPEVMQALGVFDGYAYFRGRRAYLAAEIARLLYESDDEETPPEAREAANLAMEQAKSRLYQIELWGDRVINKLGFRLLWQFDINGEKTFEPSGAAKELIDADIDTDKPWPVSFWFGGWDGDLLIGYMRGTLTIPLRTDS